MKLNGKRVAILVEKLYEDLELWYPYYRLKEEGADVELVGPSSDTVYSSKHGYPARSDVAAKDVDESRYAGLVIPGGYAPDHMRRDPASRLILSRACAFISLVRNQSARTSDGAPEISATFVSLSRNSSL